MAPVKFELNTQPPQAPEGTVHQIYQHSKHHREHEVPDEKVKEDLEAKLEKLRDVLRWP